MSLEQIEDIREKNHMSIKSQLKETNKMEHLEYHLKAFNNEFDRIINSLDSNKKYNLNSSQRWENGGIVTYKPTEQSFYTTVLEYFDPSGTQELVDEWIIEEYLQSLRDWKSFVAKKVLTNVPYFKLGFAASVFYDTDDVVKYISKRALLLASESETGSATVHYYIGPVEKDTSAVVWTWDTYPIVHLPSQEYNDVIDPIKN